MNSEQTCSSSSFKSSSAKKKLMLSHNRKKKSWRSSRGLSLIKRTVNSNFRKKYRRYPLTKLQRNASNNCSLCAKKPILRKSSWCSRSTLFTRRYRHPLKRPLKSSRSGLQNPNSLLIQSWQSLQLLRVLSLFARHQAKQKLAQFVFLLWKCSRQSLLKKSRL